MRVTFLAAAGRATGNDLRLLAVIVPASGMVRRLLRKAQG